MDVFAVHERLVRDYRAYTGSQGQARRDEERRFLLRCELDAAFFHLYGLERDEADHVMETFPVVKRRDIDAHGAYRTKDAILGRYDPMAKAAETGEPCRTPLHPPPGERHRHPDRADG